MKKTFKKLKLSTLSTAVALTLSTMAYQTAQADDDYQKIGDLEVYKAAEGGSTTITMMLDISGSMAAIDGGSCGLSLTPPKSATVTYNLKDKDGNVIKEIDSNGKKLDISGGVKLFHFGVMATDGRKYYCSEPSSRMDKLKKAMLDLISQEGVLKDEVKLGVGTFPTQHNWSTGQVSVPAKPLTREHRWRLMRYISSLTPVGSTPSAQAYLEAGAYMLGTTTAKLGAAEKRVITVGSMQIVNGNAFQLLYCGSASSYNIVNNKVVNNTPFNVSSGGSTLKWYTCNDGNNRQFPPIDFDMATQSGAAQATINPNRMSKLDFNLFPEFDTVVGFGRTTTTNFPATAMTNATAPKDPQRWRNSYNQFAEQYHFGRTINYRTPSLVNSGFPLSSDDTKKPDGNTYQSPITTKAGEVGCDGFGIYFLTDGQPNSGTDEAFTSAALSLDKPGRYTPTVSSAQFPNGQGGYYGLWTLIGSYAKDLSTGNNPLGAKIKTATVGFGSVFTPKGGLPTTTKQVGGNTITVTDCDAITSSATDGTTNDARNLCKLGERGYGYGEGGFLATSDAAAVSQSVLDFAESLNQTISATPAGTISIPSDPLNALTIQPYAYLPMIQPYVDTNQAIWDGNLKRYNTLFGTLFGRNNGANQRLYRPNPAKASTGNTNFPIELNPDAHDLWQTGAGDASQIKVGGTRAKIAKKDGDNVSSKTSRVVYIEGGTVAAPIALKVQVKNGKVLINDSDAYNGTQLIRYTIEDFAYLMDYLGFSVPKTGSNYSGSTIIAQLQSLNAELAKNTTVMRAESVFGGVAHSVPVLAAYQGQFNDAGNIDSVENRNDFLLYGTMDGALRMTTAVGGDEQFAFIPRTIFEQQKEAFVPSVKRLKNNQPYFGVDAPWVTSAKYDYSNTGTTATEMYAYGGLRMGGSGIYGLNITNPATPSLAFAITNQTSGFERLGQTWAKPTLTKIKLGTQETEVLVFGGGYDMCYENPKFVLNDTANTDTACVNKAKTQGNAIYMVHAKGTNAGQLIAKWQDDSGSTGDESRMIHSFVGEIIPLDRNNNGVVDSLYAADLGGQLFRIDLKEGASASSMTRRVVRVFDANDGLPAGTLPLRFYERPSVSFYDHNGGTLAMVNIASGDRSSPLHTHRDTIDKSNRIYGIIDRDLTTFRVAQTGSAGMISRNLTTASLNAYTTENLETTTPAVRKKFIDDLKDGTKQGWWYPMTRFDRYTNVKNLKAIGSSMVMGSIFYTSIYNPDYQYTKGDSCSARVVGATERQMYCLPWGICANPDNGNLIAGAKNGTLGFTKAGPGIQEMAMTTVTAVADESTNFRTFISQQTLAEQELSATQAGTSTVKTGDVKDQTVVHGGVGSDPQTGGKPLPVRTLLKVNRWYDLATAESNQ